MLKIIFLFYLISSLFYYIFPFITLLTFPTLHLSKCLFRHIVSLQIEECLTHAFICINNIVTYHVSCYFHSPLFLRSFHAIQCKSSSLLLTTFLHMHIPNFTWPFPQVAHNFLLVHSAGVKIFHHFL